MTRNDTLHDWPREFHSASASTPFLLYVVFGTSGCTLNLSRQKYRCDGVPDALDLMAYGPGQHPEALHSFRSGYLWQEIQAQSPALAARIAAQDKCVVLRGSFGDESTLNYFRDTVGLLTCLLDHGGVAIYDPQSFKWWSADEWKNTVFAPAALDPHHHVVILVSEEADDTQWFHTRGLRKFVRPDLSLHHVPAACHETVKELFDRFIAFQAFGGVIGEGQEIRMKTLPAGMVCRHGGTEDDPECTNAQVEIFWPPAREN